MFRQLYIFGLSFEVEYLKYRKWNPEVIHYPQTIFHTGIGIPTAKADLNDDTWNAWVFFLNLSHTVQISKE